MIYTTLLYYNKPPYTNVGFKENRINCKENFNFKVNLQPKLDKVNHIIYIWIIKKVQRLTGEYH